MKILFMGTSDFCIPILEMLIKKEYDIVGIVTKPDNKFKKKSPNQYSIMKKFALEKNILLFQPNILDDEFLDKINNLEIDIIVVTSYGKILPISILKRYKCINIHGSLLPKYRGPSPIQYAILNGETTTGITIILMDEKIDTGNILAMEKINILKNDNTKTLTYKLSILSSKLLIFVLMNINTIIPKKQINKYSSYTKLISKEDSYINWNSNYKDIINFVNAMNPWPVARTIIDKKIVKIYKLVCIDKNINVSIKKGTIVSKNFKDGLCIQCMNGILKILKLQFPNSKIMSSSEYIIGHKISDIIL